MQYQKLISGDTIIEVHNSWLGEETITANGQVVSKKSSIAGTNHYFTVMEEGRSVRYVLTTRLTEMMQVALDLTRNGELIHDGVIMRYGSRPRKPVNTAKKKGLKLLHEYSLDEAIEQFEFALDLEPHDPEIHFHMACAHSVMERSDEGFESLRLAVAHGLKDTDAILQHDMLAFLRMDERFEGFLESGLGEE